MVNLVVPEGTHLHEARKVARQLARIDQPLMSQTKLAINRAYSIMGLEQALEAGLEIDTLIEGEGMPTKQEFLAIVRDQGLRAALAWRDREGVINEGLFRIADEHPVRFESTGTLDDDGDGGVPEIG